MSETLQLVIRQRNIAEQHMQIAEQRELAALRERDAALARVRALEAGLVHAEQVGREIRTIAEHDLASGVDDGRDYVIPATERLQEIVRLVDLEILDGPSPFRAALAGGA